MFRVLTHRRLLQPIINSTPIRLLALAKIMFFLTNIHNYSKIFESAYNRGFRQHTRMWQYIIFIIIIQLIKKIKYSVLYFTKPYKCIRIMRCTDFRIYKINPSLKIVAHEELKFGFYMVPSNIS